MKIKFNAITAMVLTVFAMSVNQVRAGASAAPRLFFAGDSTLDDAGFSLSGKFRDPYRSWGTMLLNWMRPECGVANYARSGASTKSFVKSGMWDKLIADVKPGDFVAIQFGHNDQKRSNDFYLKNRWADPNGLFREIVRGWVKDVRAKGATALLLSPIRRATFDKDGRKLLDKASRGVCLRSYRDAMQELSVELGCDFIDMNEMTKHLMESIGRDESYKFFINPVKTSSRIKKVLSGAENVLTRALQRIEKEKMAREAAERRAAERKAEAERKAAEAARLEAENERD